MDANGTPFHLLLGQDDWSRCVDAESGQTLAALWSTTSPPDEPSDLVWDPRRKDLTLRPELALFTAGKADRAVTLADRRGNARDRFGNWFWIDADPHQIRVRNAGDASTPLFWPPPAPTEPQPAPGAFHPVQAQAACVPLPLAGLAITRDHYLVAGVSQPPGLLRFDLQGGGPPRRTLWPADLVEPFDLAPLPLGGIVLLDRTHRRLWQFDRAFQVVRPNPSTPVAPLPGSFLPAEPDSTTAPALQVASGISVTDATPLPLADPIAVDSLPDGSVLVLDRRPGESLPFLAHFRDGRRLPDPTGLDTVTDLLDDTVAASFRLVAHDFVVVPIPDPAASSPFARLYLVAQEGNQAFAFDLTWENDRLHLHASPEFLPLRRFGGRALALGGDQAFYDSQDAWVPLIAQIRPRFVEAAELTSPVFDSHSPGCIWHRLLLDAALPAESGIEVWTRAADAEDELFRLDWAPEPHPLRRPEGTELPWLRPETAPERGTWETLIQRSTGRFAQIRLRLFGNARVTPRVHALRLYAPRFSYLRNYLPPVYREDDTSASFLERFLANFEGQLSSLEDRIAAVQVLFDARTAPPETLDWLANWFGAALDPAWDEHRRRLFLQNAMTFFAYRGTVRGLHMALRLMFDPQPDASLFTNPQPPKGRAARYRIVERFRQRPPLFQPDPASDTPTNRWTPDLGSVALHQRWRETLGDAASAALFPVRRPSDNPDRWETFSRATLGFVPRAAESDLASWQNFLEQRYTTIDAFNLIHLTSWSAFGEIPLPATLPADGLVREDWDLFKLDVRGPDAATQEKLWHDFLRRRYRNARLLRDVYGATALAFDDVPLPTTLPSHPQALADWFVFEGVVLPMHGTAHRFTVLLPLTTAQMRQSSAQRRDLLQLADRLVHLEKPAHTIYDVRFFWAAFRIGTARLGDDTLIGAGSREPDLLPALQLGAGYLSESYISALPPRDRTDRIITGQTRVPRTPRSTSILRRPL